MSVVRFAEEDGCLSVADASMTPVFRLGRWASFESICWPPAGLEWVERLADAICDMRRESIIPHHADVFVLPDGEILELKFDT